MNLIWSISPQSRATLSRLGINDFSLHINASYPYPYKRSEIGQVEVYSRPLNQLGWAAEKWIGSGAECNLIPPSLNNPLSFRVANILW